MIDSMIKKIVPALIMGMVAMDSSYGMENPIIDNIDLIENIDVLPQTSLVDQNTDQLPETEAQKTEISVTQEPQKNSQNGQATLMTSDHYLILTSPTALLTSIIEGQIFVEKALQEAWKDAIERANLRREVLEKHNSQKLQIEQFYKENPQDLIHFVLARNEAVSVFYKKNIEGMTFGNLEHPLYPTKYCTEAQAKALITGIIDQQKTV